MKIKKINKRLSLNKKTIANLANAEQKLVRGGALNTDGCPPAPPTNILTCETECVSCHCTEAGYFTCVSCDFSCPDVGTCDTCITGGTGGVIVPETDLIKICR